MLLIRFSLVSLSWLCQLTSLERRKSLILQASLESPGCGVILRRNPRLGQRIEQSAFTHVGQTNDAAFQTHEKSL
jgi:hypothetical protein